MELAVCQAVTAENQDLGDLMLGPDGDEVVLTQLPDEAAQRLFVRLAFFQGEWRRDLASGTPYYQRILKKAPSDRIVRAIFMTVINQTEGVSQVTKFSYSVNRQRQMALTFDAILQDGSTFRSTEYPAFHVSL